MTLLLALLTLPFSILTICFTIELIVGLRPLPDRPNAASAVDGVLIVPAHDEEPVLEANLRNLINAVEGSVRILLVADNCTDGTAHIGRQSGVEVIERADPARRGKGFALDFARAHLERRPPDAVTIVDADCSIDGASVSTLLAAAVATGRPCQATNLQRPSSTASVTVQLSTFAFFIKNVIRQRALQRLTGGCHLLGTGMAIPWPIFASAQLATSSIVEDVKLGLELRGRGQAPLFVERAEVWSKAETDANTLSQRQRWEGGSLANGLRSSPAIFAQALRRADVQALWSAIDILIPPLALLVLVDALVVTLCTVLALTGLASAWPAIILGAALAGAGVATALAWDAGGSRFIGLGALARAPLYIAWKLSMYAGFVKTGAPREWRRTERQ